MALKRILLEERQIGDDAWQVTEMYSCLDAEIASMKASLWMRRIQGLSGKMTPLAVSVKAQKSFFAKGKAMLHAVYQTPTLDQYMARYTPKGVVYVRSYAKGQQVTTDVSGKMLNGIDPDDSTGRTVWKIVRGSAAEMRPHTVYRVHAVVNSKTMYVDAFVDKVGMVNSGMMTRLGQYGAGAGELILIAMNARPLPYNKTKYVVDYDFLWSGDKGVDWNDMGLSRKFEKKAVQVEQIDTDGDAVAGGEKIHVTLVPSTSTRAVSVFKSTSFDRINRLCMWV